MYAVIFKAQIAELNDEYSKTAAKMRELAFSKYGCLDFVAVCEGEQEVAISYWPDEQSVLYQSIQIIAHSARVKSFRGKALIEVNSCSIVKINNEAYEAFKLALGNSPAAR